MELTIKKCQSVWSIFTDFFLLFKIYFVEDCCLSENYCYIYQGITLFSSQDIIFRVSTAIVIAVFFKKEFWYGTLFQFSGCWSGAQTQERKKITCSYANFFFFCTCSIIPDIAFGILKIKNHLLCFYNLLQLTVCNKLHTN